MKFILYTRKSYHKFYTYMKIFAVNIASLNMGILSYKEDILNCLQYYKMVIALHLIHIISGNDTALLPDMLTFFVCFLTWYRPLFSILHCLNRLSDHVSTLFPCCCLWEQNDFLFGVNYKETGSTNTILKGQCWLFEDQPWMILQLMFNFEIVMFSISGKHSNFFRFA